MSSNLFDQHRITPPTAFTAGPRQEGQGNQAARDLIGIMPPVTEPQPSLGLNSNFIPPIKSLISMPAIPSFSLYLLGQQDITNMAASPIPAQGMTIAIIGAGSVGSTIAHSLLIRRVVADIILVDIDEALCRAQVEDLSDGTFLSNVRIRQGSFKDASQADIIIVTAGAKQRPGDTRLDLIDRNFRVLKSVLEGMKPMRQDAILLLVANPVDVLTSAAMRMSGLGPGQVIGSGTLLDSVRLTRLLASKLKVLPSIRWRRLHLGSSLRFIGVRKGSPCHRHRRARRLTAGCLVIGLMFRSVIPALH